MNPTLIDSGGPSGGHLVGWVLVAAGALDVLIALFFALVRPPREERARRVLPMMFGASAAVCFALGGLFLAGVLGNAAK